MPMTPRRRLANQRCHAKRKERQRTGPPVPSLIHPGSNNDLTTDQEKRNAVLLYGDPQEPETIAQSITAKILALREAKEEEALRTKRVCYRPEGDCEERMNVTSPTKGNLTMQVETFECSETAAEPIEATEEAVSLMESLGLSGQMELVRPKDESRPASRSPYRHMTAEEYFVYSTICPTVVPLERYNASPIPLRVLQIASHVKSLEICKTLEVWDKAAHVVKDPVLVGCVPDPTYAWMVKHRFILARWGEVLETFSVLMKRAIESRREKLVSEAQAISKLIECATPDELMKHSQVQW